MDNKTGSGMKLGYAIFTVNLLVSVLTYPMLPDSIIMHWNAGGIPDGYGSKLSGFLLMQFVSVFILGLFVLIPKIDPLQKVKTSSGYYTKLMNLILGYFMVFNMMFIAQNMGYSFNMTSVLMPLMGVLFYALGDILGDAEQNWFVGVKTPWTLSSESVWASTHKKAESLFKASGALGLIGLIYPTEALWLFLGSVLFTSLYLVAFSYREYKKLEL